VTHQKAKAHNLSECRAMKKLSLSASVRQTPNCAPANAARIDGAVAGPFKHLQIANESIVEPALIPAAMLSRSSLPSAGHTEMHQATHPPESPDCPPALRSYVFQKGPFGFFGSIANFAGLTIGSPFESRKVIKIAIAARNDHESHSEFSLFAFLSSRVDFVINFWIQ
jgi:hypothetical protein